MTKAIGRSIRSLFVFNNAETVTFFDYDLAWSSLSRMEKDDVPDAVEKLTLSSREHRKLNFDSNSPPDPRIM